jgi:hypothetical protein
MKLKPLALTTVIAIGIAGFAEAGNQYHASADPEQLLSLASERLALNPAQLDKLRPLLQQALALRADVKTKAAALRAASRQELQRPDADLRALSGERQALLATELKSIDALRERFLTFYERELSPSQQVSARQLLLKRLDRFDRLRERMMAVADAGAFAP